MLVHPDRGQMGDDLTVGAFHVDVNPGVRIDPLHLRHGALQCDRLLCIEFSRKRMVRRDRCGGQNQETRGQQA